MTSNTMKAAGLTAAMALTVGSLAVLATPSETHAVACVSNPSIDDFDAGYLTGSVTKAHVAYTNDLPMCEGASKMFSLTAYLTEGPDWETSGKQTFVDHMAVTLTADKTEADLEVKLPEGNCFYQTDLYANGLRYDGTAGQGALPHYPDSDTPYDEIDARTGGTEVCQGGSGSTTPTPSPTPTPQVLGDSTVVTTLPRTGADMSGLVAMSVGLVGGAASYLRGRRNR